MAECLFLLNRFLLFLRWHLQTRFHRFVKDEGRLQERQITNEKKKREEKSKSATETTRFDG